MSYQYYIEPRPLSEVYVTYQYTFQELALFMSLDNCHYTKTFFFTVRLVATF